MSQVHHATLPSAKMKGMLYGVDIPAAIRELRGMPQEKILRVLDRIRRQCASADPLSPQDIRILVAVEVVSRKTRPESIQRVIVWDWDAIAFQTKPTWRAV